MATFDKTKETGPPPAAPVVTMSSGARVDWTRFTPVAVGSEDAMSPQEVKRVWESIYAAVGKATASEAERNEIRFALYVYAAVNGTSPQGKYSADVKTASGHTFSAAVIPRCVGRHMIRAFFRANMDEAYEALKSTRALEVLAQRYVTAWEQRGVPRELVFATADFLRNCRHFTPQELEVNVLASNFGISRARRARGGKTLEQVEREEVEETLRAQGPVMGGPVKPGMFDF